MQYDKFQEYDSSTHESDGMLEIFHQLANGPVYFSIFVKLMIGLCAMMAFIRLYGKKLMSQVTPFDFINIVVSGGIIGGVIYNPNYGVVDMLYTLVAWSVINKAAGFLLSRYRCLRLLIQGEYTPLVVEGKLQPAGFKDANLELEQFRMLLRAQGIYSVQEVRYAQLEANGQLTVKGFDKQDVSVPLVSEGNFDIEELKRFGKDERWARERLALHGINDIDRIFYAESRENGELSVTYYAV